MERVSLKWREVGRNWRGAGDDGDSATVYKDMDAQKWRWFGISDDTPVVYMHVFDTEQEAIDNCDNWFGGSREIGQGGIVLND